MQRSLFTHFEQDSWLASLNPAVKLLIALAVMLLASIIFDHVTLISLLALGLALLLALGRIHPWQVLRGLFPFMLFGLGFLWMNALLPRTSGTVLLTLGPMSVSQEGLLNGISFFLRALVFGVWSLLFVATTNPTWFVLSLVHQLKVPPRFAYSALAAYRYLPALQQELAQIQAAHRLRGVGEAGGLRGKFQRARRYTIPLLTGALRRATRVAAAMEARAFTGINRSWYRQPRLQTRDLMFAALIVSLIIALLVWSGHTGHLRLWRGHLWE